MRAFEFHLIYIFPSTQILQKKEERTTTERTNVCATWFKKKGAKNVIFLKHLA